ncbi:MAG: DJ-1/PfpI family protein [Candidatus Nanohaloarchaea archaeon]|nr:DJ-1/PfpI family protein [Candidatus Nanohaloarchaea archaeon]
MAVHRGEVAVILPEGNVRDEEVNGLSRVFESRDFHLTFATPSGDDARGNGGMLVLVDAEVADLDVEQFDAVVVVGCRDSFPALNTVPVRTFVREALEAGLVIAGVCEAVRLLAEMGILEDAEVAVPKNLQIDVEQYVGGVCGEPACRSGTVFTSKGGDVTEEVAEQIVSFLQEQEEA